MGDFGGKYVELQKPITLIITTACETKTWFQGGHNKVIVIIS